jgi:hypothetical protein
MKCDNRQIIGCMCEYVCSLRCTAFLLFLFLFLFLVCLVSVHVTSLCGGVLALDAFSCAGRY